MRDRCPTRSKSRTIESSRGTLIMSIIGLVILLSYKMMSRHFLKSDIGAANCTKPLHEADRNNVVAVPPTRPSVGFVSS